MPREQATRRVSERDGARRPRPRAACAAPLSSARRPEVAATPRACSALRRAELADQQIATSAAAMSSGVTDCRPRHAATPFDFEHERARVAGVAADSGHQVDARVVERRAPARGAHGRLRERVVEQGAASHAAPCANL